ncbi:hypothetical protein CAPTEDRAFT_221733 [Capitella teleta]|uniref:C2H2-type domain-containing protein n=1 Tax=Capitella teleta TaxID=283909 RepID=R7UYN5_CAPTE|nr:hypothetical protein CAPTEDRAFT_221733 [Capitella teleta]|eukprot:ELU11397.1 hypothetical protein CAPTEDRAFT_221733 [Capitella teleta]
MGDNRELYFDLFRNFSSILVVKPQGSHRQKKSVVKHAGPKRFFCPVKGCIRNVNNGRFFPTYKLLKQHYMKTHAEKSFVCDKCDARFSVQRDLLRHQRIDCERSFKCGECSADFNQRILLLTHCKRQGHSIPPAHLKPPAKKLVTAHQPTRVVIPASDSQAPSVKETTLLPKPGYALVPCHAVNNSNGTLAVTFSNQMILVAPPRSVKPPPPPPAIKPPQPILPKILGISSQTEAEQKVTSMTQTTSPAKGAQSVAQTQTAKHCIVQEAMHSAQIPVESRACQVSPKATHTTDAQTGRTEGDLSRSPWDSSTQTQTTSMTSMIEESISTQTQESFLNAQLPIRPMTPVNTTCNTGTDPLLAEDLLNFDLEFPPQNQTTQTLETPETRTVAVNVINFDDYLSNVNMETQTNADNVFDMLLSNMETQTLNSAMSHNETQTLNLNDLSNVQTQTNTAESSFIANESDFSVQTNFGEMQTSFIETQTNFDEESFTPDLPIELMDMQTQTILPQLQFSSALTDSHTQTMLQDLQSFYQ